MQRIVVLTLFTMFSLVTSLTHTFVSLVRKSNQASCVVMAHTEATLVLVKTYFAFRHGFDATLVERFNECNQKVTTHRHNVSNLLSSVLIRGDEEGTKQECRNVGFMNCNFSVTFIKSLNQSDTKPCLVVYLVAM